MKTTLPLLAAMVAAPIAQAASPAQGICVSLAQTPADAAYLQCLNAELAVAPEAADDARAAMELATGAGAARGPAAMGLYTRAATELRLGPNFGISPVPFRPDAVYRNPFVPPVTGR